MSLSDIDLLLVLYVSVFDMDDESCVLPGSVIESQELINKPPRKRINRRNLVMRLSF